MIKTSLLTALLFLTLAFGVGVFAQSAGLPNPGITPDSPFYFLEKIFEEIGTFFTFGDLNKAARYATLASERIAEAEAMANKGKSEAAQKALAKYEAQLKESLARIESAKNKGKLTGEVTESLAEITTKHLSVLDEALDKSSEEAKTGIERARTISINGQKSALRFLAGENPEAATEINLKAAEARLNRAKAKAEDGNAEETDGAIIEFENQHRLGEEISQIAQSLGKDITATEQLVEEAASIHLEILAEVYEKAPEQAKESIEKAMETRVHRLEQAQPVSMENNSTSNSSENTLHQLNPLNPEQELNPLNPTLETGEGGEGDDQTESAAPAPMQTPIEKQ